MAPQYSIKQRPQQNYVCTRHRVPMTGLSGLAPHIARLFAALAKHGVEPTGAPFFRYRTVPHSMDDESLFDIDVGVPIKGNAEIKDLESHMSIDTLPEGKYLETKMIGHPSGLGRATKHLLEWAEEHDFEFDVQRGDTADSWGARSEWYETDPKEEPDMDKWVNIISIRLVDQ